VDGRAYQKRSQIHLITHEQKELSFGSGIYKADKRQNLPSKVNAPAQLSLSSASYPPGDLNDIELELQDELERDKVGLDSVEPLVVDIARALSWVRGNDESKMLR
jgi:hypothetical protein